MTTATLPEGVRITGSDVRWYKRTLGFINKRESGFCVTGFVKGVGCPHPFWERERGCYATEADASQALIDQMVDYDAHRASTKTKRFPRYSR